MLPGRYVLSRNTISIGGDYTLKDAAAATVMTFDGKLRFAAVFTAMDAQGHALFTGREHVLNLEQRFEFERDGIAHATMLREWVGAIRLIGSQAYRYVVTCRTGDRLETTGYVLTNWAIRRRDAIVAQVESDGYVHTVDLVDGDEAGFVMTVVMAVVRLNKPANVGSPAD
ncbi:MAG: hypothetical protein ABJC89_13300 [Acidobacteriota bacterium]